MRSRSVGALVILVAALVAGTFATPRPAAALHSTFPSAVAPDGAAAGASKTWVCPMCEDVRSEAPGRCPRCGMPLVQRGGHAADLPLMPGLPPAVFYAVALGILVVSFVLLGVRAGRAARAPPRRYDLIRVPGLGRLLRWHGLPLALQLPVVALFVLVVVAGLVGNPAPERNLAPVLTWTIWWATLVLLVLALGKLWCTACPWMAIADWIGRLVPRLERPWPRALRSIWPATALFVGLTWLELGYGVTGKPWLTAVLGLVMLAFAVGTVVVFERRGFCRYACLVGRVSGLYATFAATELRAADPRVCRTCATKDCYHGNAAGAPCPTKQYLGAMHENTYCTLCLACVQTCPEGNVAWNVRPLGADLLGGLRARADEAWLAVIMLALAAFHGLTMTPAWDRLVVGIDRTTGIGTLAAFTLGMAAMLALPIAAYAGVCALMRWVARDRRHGVRTLFVRFAYSLLPIALFYHLAHNLQHVLYEGAKLVRTASDPLGWGWNLFGTSTMPVHAMLSMEASWTLQVTLVLVGHVYAIVIADRTARNLYSDANTATVSQVPMLAAMLLFSFQSLWLLSQPMLMRTAM